MAASVIRNFIAKQLFKKKGAIANNKSVEFSANALEQRLLSLGIDPNLIRSEQELNQILNLVKQAEDQAFNQRFGNVLSRSNLERKGEVFDMAGQKINPQSKIMGGKQAETEAEIAARMSKENKEATQRIREKSMAKAFSQQDLEEMDQAIFNLTERQGISGDSKVDADFLAEELAALRGIKYDDMPTKERIDLYGRAYDKLQMDKFKKKFDPPEDFATGGRAGFKTGMSKAFLEFMKKFKVKQSGDDLKDFLSKRKFLKDMVGNTEKNKRARESAMLKEAMEKARKEGGYKFKDIDVDKDIRPIFDQSKDRTINSDGGRAGYRFGIGPLLELLSKTSPKQAGQKYLKSVKDRAMTDPKKLAPEMGAVAATGIFVNRRMKDVLENMKNQDMENNLENFIKELDADPFYNDYPELKDKMIEGYTERMFGEKRADGGRIGYKDGKSLLDMIDVQASGSKSGKQQIKGAPEGITADEESINAIIKADIPISQKIDLLADYQYGKGRTRIEKDDQEIFLDEGGFKNRNVGLGFNKDGEGFSGSVMRNLETGDDNFKIRFLKRFANGGRIGLKAGMTKRAFLKLMGGTGAAIGAAKSGIFSGFGKGAGKQVAKEVVKKSTSTPPAYFFELANKIKTLGRVSDGPAERIKIHSMPAKDGKSELMLTEDIGTGEMQIKKIGKEEDMTTKVETMEYTPGSSQADETTQGIPADSYDEFTEFNSRIIKDEYNDPIVENGVDVKEIIEEVKDQAPSIKKAGGGIARMLGE
jgi:hypothetical protein